ncbi:MAG: hypothetical protein AB9880_08275 [Christensenellales bacterium]
MKRAAVLTLALALLLACCPPGALAMLPGVHSWGTALAGSGQYVNNTVGARGFYLRELLPPRTDKWYMLSPLDISRDGSLRIDLIAGNCLVVGSAVATVQGDRLTVDYVYLEGVREHSQLLMLYTDLEDIGELSPDLLQSPYRFREGISISGALEGQPRVLLYINNRVSFPSGLKGLRPYTALGDAEVVQRRTLANEAGLGGVYRERLPKLALSAERPDAEQPEVPGLICEDGVCHVPLP